MIPTLALLTLATSWPPPLTIRVEPVGETCLVGEAEGAYWEAALAAEGLRPALREGKATVTVCATRARFGGRAFGEGTLGVETEDGGQLLVSAINDVRFYAWVERRRNDSPYVHGEARRDAGGARLGTDEGMALEAQRGARAGEVRQSAFVGPIYLPAMGGRPGGAFYAELRGEATVCAFDPALDRLELGPSPFAEPLRASGWRPVAWRTDEDAVHAKSDTVPRPAR